MRVNFMRIFLFPKGGTFAQKSEGTLQASRLSYAGRTGKDVLRQAPAYA